MFDLKQQVNDWCRSAIPETCGDEAQLAELEDHLYCEIERLERAGLSQAEAFARATTQMGEARMITNEYVKNQTFAGRLCALDRRLSGIDRIADLTLKKKASRLLIGNSLLWAAAMIATALLAGDSANAGYLVPVVFIPLWFGSFLLINTTMGSLDKSS